MSDANVKMVLPDPIVQGESTATPPANLAEQIEALQKQLRAVRARQAQDAERRATLEDSLAKLHAEAGLERKLGKLDASLSPAERDVLARRKAHVGG